MGLYNYEIKHLKMLRKGLSECSVLLKYNGDFPLDKPCDIALYGRGVRHTIKGGTGSGEVNSRFFETVEKGFKKANFRITSRKWLDAYDEVAQNAHKRFVSDVKMKARKAGKLAMIYGMGMVMPEPEYNIPIDAEGDVAIYVLSRTSGEGSDRKPKAGDILLTKTEIRDIKEIQSKYKKFMLVLNVGGPVDLSPVMDVENILLLSQLGVQTGSALCDMVLGRTNPSGKLSTSWTKWNEYQAIGEFGDINETRYKEGIFVGYRYFDSVGQKALFPFGYGLSYTSFSIDDIDVVADGCMVNITASVKNTGKRAGKEVVQLYVSSPAGKLPKPYQSLAGFVKTKNLYAGESQVVSLSVNMKDIASYDTESAAYILEKGDYIFRIGNSSDNTEAVACIRLDGTAVVKQLANKLGHPDFEDYVPDGLIEYDTDDDIKILELSSDIFETENVNYSKDYEIDDYVKTLTDEQLVQLSIGAYKGGNALSGVIGNQSFAVAGAAGESCAPDGTDFRPIVMADGPAGLRLNKKYFKDEKGVHAVGFALPETFADYTPYVAKLFLKFISAKPKNVEDIKFQYATAIPIGTAIAQSFNYDFAYTCGDIVGSEMEMFGVDLWLAPALNIHRSILCGRNFEYYSEDPLVSGKIAAAITNGVQKHKNCGTTIKHYAANNQETNRYYSNSQVSERAMREIYLKGFEICVKESQPRALMTSYNLLNGGHTSESRDLINDILRCEWGYEGIVMTDWVIANFTSEPGSVYKCPDVDKVAAAGTEVFMPGSQQNYDDLLKALNSGKITRQQLEINISRLYRLSKGI